MAFTLNAVVVLLIVIVSVAEPVPPAFVALIVTAVMPGVVGVPEIAPVAVFTERPAGSPVALKLVGVLLAVIVYENAEPTEPVAVVALLMTGGAGLIVNVRVAVPLPPAFAAPI